MADDLLMAAVGPAGPAAGSAVGTVGGPAVEAKQRPSATFQFLDQKRADALQCIVCIDQKTKLSCCAKEGHIVCDDCLAEMKARGPEKEKGKEHPACPLKCASTKFQPDVRAGREVAELDIVCDGCGNPLKFGDWQTHVSSCVALVRECKVPGCGSLPAGENIEQHMADPLHALKHVKLYEARCKNWAATAHRIAEAAAAEVEFKMKLGKKRLRPDARIEEEERLAKKSRYLVAPTKTALALYNDMFFETTRKALQEKKGTKKVAPDTVRRVLDRKFRCVPDSHRKPYIKKANDMRRRACRPALNAIGIDASKLTAKQLEEPSMAHVAASVFAATVAEGKECKSAAPITAPPAPMPRSGLASGPVARARRISGNDGDSDSSESDSDSDVDDDFSGFSVDEDEEASDEDDS